VAEVHNALHRAGALIAGLRRMVGAGADVQLERLGETLTPILNPWGLPEWAKLRGEQLYAVTTLQAAVAGEFAGIALDNPAGSNAIVVVDAVKVSQVGAVADARLENMLTTAISGTYLIVAQPGSLRDRRFRSTFGSIARIRQGTDVTSTFGAQLEHRSCAVNADSPFSCLPVVLQPGESLAAILQTVNLTLRVNWVWRERSALPGELV
jgi:hypothetical protein